MLIGGLFLLFSVSIGIVLCNLFFKRLDDLSKISAGFLLGIFFTSIIVFISALILQSTKNPLQSALFITLIIQTLIILFVLRHKKDLLKLILSRFEILISILFLFFGFYIMQKGFSYDGYFNIASNLYPDFGTHLPIIRSFSLGNNIPPTFPFLAEKPLAYHFLFDFTVGLYEKLGVQIGVALNTISALSFAAVLILIFSISRHLFDSKYFVPFTAVILFIFNSSASFVSAIEKYGLNLSKFYHHNIYLGNGPFGENVVSVFWNLNTYLNQRHFLFGLGIGLLIILYILTIKKSGLRKKEIFFLALIIGLLPFWHGAVFISVLLFIFGLFLASGWQKKRGFAQIIILSLLIALPQLFILKNGSINGIIFNPGFLMADYLSFFSVGKYWFYNLGVSLITIPLGMYLASKNAKIMIVPLIILFLAPNIFQFSPTMFDNHKFFNMFIIFANMYSAYFIYYIWRKRTLGKVVALILLFLLIFSGVLDFFVIKNDVKTRISDYPKDNFMSWITINTKPEDKFLTNGEIYDPVTLVGRKTTVGRMHYPLSYGINIDRLANQRQDALADIKIERIMKLREDNINYIVVYSEENIPKRVENIKEEKLKSLLPIVYQDGKANVYKLR